MDASTFFFFGCDSKIVFINSTQYNYTLVSGIFECLITIYLYTTLLVTERYRLRTQKKGHKKYRATLNITSKFIGYTNDQTNKKITIGLMD